MAESFFGTLECELLDRRCFPSAVEARMALFDYIEGWYHPRRRHSSLGYRSPMNVEVENGPWGRVEHPGLAEGPADPESAPAGLGSTPLQAAEALLTPWREEEEDPLAQPQYSLVH